MRHIAVLCAPLPLLALTLTACGDDNGGSASPSGTSGAATDQGAEGAERGAGAYEGELEDGSMLRVVLDVDADDPAVAPFEAFRAETGAPVVTWIVAEIDVPDGTDGTGRFVSFVAEGLDPLDDDPSDDSDGITNAEFACSMLDDWSAAAPDPDAVADDYLALYEDDCAGQSLQVLAPGGETTRYVLVYEGELPAFERMFAGLATELRPV